MKCDICKKNKATVHLTRYSASKRQRAADLCETCAKAKGIPGVGSRAPIAAKRLSGLLKPAKAGS